MLGYSVISLRMRSQCEVILALGERAIAGSEVVKDDIGEICEAVEYFSCCYVIKV